MVTLSGIVLPGENPLTLRQDVKGLFVAIDAYQRDVGYFGQSPLYPREQPASESHSEKPKSPPQATFAE